MRIKILHCESKVYSNTKYSFCLTHTHYIIFLGLNNFFGQNVLNSFYTKTSKLKSKDFKIDFIYNYFQILN